MPILDAALSNVIRTILGETAAVVPDTVLANTVIGEAAEATVIAWVGALPAYASRPAGEQASIRTALAYLTAANYVITQRSRYGMTSEKYSSQYAYTRGATDVDRWYDDLYNRARDAILHLIPVATTVRTQSMFRLAAGRRGQGL